MSGVEAGAITWGELGFGRGRGIVRRPSIPRSFPAALPETQVILGGSQTAVDVGSLIEEGEILSNGGILYSWGIELPNGGIIVAKAPSEINAKRRTLEDIFGPDGDLLSQAVLAPFVSSKSPLVWAGVGISAGYDAVKASIASLSLGREVNLEEAEGMSLAQVSPTLDRALRITLAASLIAGDVTGGPSGIKQIIEGYPQPSDDNPSTPDGGSGNHNDGQGPLAKIINRAATIITGLPLILTRKDSQQDEVTPGCTGAFPTQTPSLEAGQDLPQPGVTVFTNPTNTPQQELAKDTPTPETVIGSVDTAFWAIPGAPEGFGGTGEYIPFKNNSTIQDNLNKNGFAPIIDATGNLSQTQVQDGLRVCIANLPEKLVSRTSPTGEEVRINSKAGIVNFGDSISNNILTKAINVVSLNELPEGWSCVNAVVIDENNPAGLGALRMLLVDSNGKIQGETPAAFSGNDNVEIRWGGNGPALYVNGELKQFSLSEEVQAAPPETPQATTQIEPTPESFEIPSDHRPFFFLGVKSSGIFGEDNPSYITRFIAPFVAGYTTKEFTDPFDRSPATLHLIRGVYQDFEGNINERLIFLGIEYKNGGSFFVPIQLETEGGKIIFLDRLPKKNLPKNFVHVLNPELKDIQDYIRVGDQLYLSFFIEVPPNISVVCQEQPECRTSHWLTASTSDDVEGLYQNGQLADGIIPTSIIQNALLLPPDR